MKWSYENVLPETEPALPADPVEEPSASPVVEEPLAPSADPEEPSASPVDPEELEALAEPEVDELAGHEEPWLTWMQFVTLPAMSWPVIVPPVMVRVAEGARTLPLMSAATVTPRDPTMLKMTEPATSMGLPPK